MDEFVRCFLLLPDDRQSGGDFVAVLVDNKKQ